MLIIEHVDLQNHLPEDLNYLNRLFGFMGPRNILKPIVELGFKEALQTVESSSEILAEGDDQFSIWNNLEGVQTKLADLIRFHRLPQFQGNAVGGDENIMDAIRFYESQLVNRIGRDSLKSAMEKIENMNIHKYYMKEWRSE
jgi:hypothetical protein